MTSKYKKSQNNFDYKIISPLNFQKGKSVPILHYAIKGIVVNVAKEFCILNKKFYYLFDDKEECVIVALNNKNYVKILVDDSNNWTVSYKYTLFKNEIINASEDLNYLISSLINDLMFT